MNRVMALNLIWSRDATVTGRARAAILRARGQTASRRPGWIHVPRAGHHLHRQDDQAHPVADRRRRRWRPLPPTLRQQERRRPPDAVGALRCPACARVARGLPQRPYAQQIGHRRVWMATRRPRVSEAPQVLDRTEQRVVVVRRHRRTPARAPGPAIKVRMCPPSATPQHAESVSPSSNVTKSTPEGPSSASRRGTIARRYRSPVYVPHECMSWQMFGTSHMNLGTSGPPGRA